MVMTVSDNDIAFAERDDTMLRGGGMESDRPYLTWGQYQALLAVRRGSETRKYALIMRMPGPKGQPGAGPPRAMPAEKMMKWYAQGFRPCVSYEDHTLIEFPAPPEPRIWLPSMVEEARNRGDAIPEEMAPDGYVGPTFSIKAMRAQFNAERAAGDVPLTPEEALASAEARARAAEAELAAIRAEATQREIKSQIAAGERAIEAERPKHAGGRPRKVVEPPEPLTI